MLISRITFLYHFYINVPILCLASAYVLNKYWNTKVINNSKTKDELQMALREFFWFLKKEKKIENQRLSKNLGIEI